MKAKNVIEVILADDHAVIRRGIRRILEKDPDILVIAEADTGIGAIQLVQEFKPDVLVLDIEMSDIGGDCVARELRSMRLPIAILILSACNDQHFIEEIMRIGVDGYLVKGVSPQKIRAAVHQVSERQNVAANTTMMFLFMALLWNACRIFDILQQAADFNLL